MNGGTRRGQADGFELGDLIRLQTTKCSGNASMSLINVVAHLALHNDATVAKLKFDFPSLAAAVRLNIADLKRRATQLQADVRKSDANYKRVVETSADVNDPFNSIISQFLSESGRQARLVASDMRRAEDNYISAVLYMSAAKNEKLAASVSAESFFGTLWEFVKEFDKALPKSDEKPKYKRKFAMGQKIGNGGMKQVMNGIKQGVTLKKAKVSKREERKFETGSMLAQILSQRRGKLVGLERSRSSDLSRSESIDISAVSGKFGDSDSDGEWE